MIALIFLLTFFQSLRLIPKVLLTFSLLITKHLGLLARKLKAVFKAE